MHRNLYNALMGLLWLGPAAIALRFGMVWDQLPVRMASHFNAAGEANGWMSRRVSLYFAVGFVLFLAGVSSAVLLVIERKYPLRATAWALLGFLHVELWTVAYMLNSILDFNLSRQPIVVAPLMVVTPFAVLALIATALGERRGKTFPAAELVAEEVHSGKGWSLIFLMALAIAAWVAAALPTPSARLGTGLLGVVFAGAFGMAYDGFHYCFTRHGVEIRTLGLRLKSIPLGQIRQYAEQPWSAVCGYGIRGVGNHKAYVWGNRGVRLWLYDGEIFLGHEDPQKIVRDLDLIRRYSHSS
jgi:hypothetical protein